MDKQFDQNAMASGSESRLAQWLLQLLREPKSEAGISAAASRHGVRPGHRSEALLELQVESSYHLRFYQQLPDFALAQLRGEEEATLRYATLLYHLVGCAECHQAYLEIYDALGAALHETDTYAMYSLGGNRGVGVTPQRMLGHLCRTLISQAEAILKQARRSHQDDDEAARALLQLALRMSARIGQSTIRQSATQDLVRVATLVQGPAVPPGEDAQVYQYTPTLAGVGARGKTVRRADVLSRPLDQPVIHLQSKGLHGSITQRERTLELHLQHLDPQTYGQRLLITVPLGSLIEPVRWRGGNPLAIRSEQPVDAHGSLVMTLGETDLNLSDPEEHNLLETLFLLLEVRISA